MFLKRGSRGDSMVEYALAAGVILGLGIFTSLVGLPQGLKAALPSLFTSETVLSTEKAIVPRPLGSDPYSTTVKIALSEDKILTLHDYPSQLASSIEVVGGEGTTTKLASVLKQLAQQLLEQGEISEAEAQEIVALANQGHRLAELESLLEASAKKAGKDRALFRNTPITDTQTGTSDSMEAFSNRLFFHFDPIPNTVSFDTLDPGVKAFYEANIASSRDTHPQLAKHVNPADKTKQFTYVGKDLADFMTLYAKANRQDGPLRHPLVHNMVTNLSKQITSIAHQTRITSHFISDPYQVYAPYTPDRLNELHAGFYTNTSSGNICAAGNSTDSGIHCGH